MGRNESGLKAWRIKYRDRNNNNNKLWRRNIKQLVINAYGGNCVCCGENKFEFLTIDHINGNGHKERKNYPGDQFYRKLKKENFPKDNYQLLCWNCNCAKGHYGACPHEQN